MPVGADEAGKGPVIGPMIAAAVRVEDPTDLPDGVADSKALTAERREALAAAMVSDAAIEIGLATVSPSTIDAPSTDMNTLTVGAHARALGEVVRPGDAGVVDASDVVAERFGRRVTERLGVPVDLEGRHRADETDPVVAAASVVAKVERDARVADLAAEFGDVGSGYPHDPTTRAFLADWVDEHGELPACARSSWRTSRDVLAAAEQAGLADF